MQNEVYGEGMRAASTLNFRCYEIQLHMEMKSSARLFCIVELIPAIFNLLKFSNDFRSVEVKVLKEGVATADERIAKFN